jgi:hypothetical protein
MSRLPGVDPIAVAEIQEIVAKLRDRDMGILITDHNVRETLSIIDRAYIMSDGQILASGSAEDLVEQSPSARALPRQRLCHLAHPSSLLTPAHGTGLLSLPGLRSKVAPAPLLTMMDRYIAKELTLPFLFGVGAFSSIGISIGALFELIRRITESGLVDYPGGGRFFAQAARIHRAGLPHVDAAGHNDDLQPLLQR